MNQDPALNSVPELPAEPIPAPAPAAEYASELPPEPAPAPQLEDLLPPEQPAVADSADFTKEVADTPEDQIMAAASAAPAPEQLEESPQANEMSSAAEKSTEAVPGKLTALFTKLKSLPATIPTKFPAFKKLKFPFLSKTKAQTTEGGNTPGNAFTRMFSGQAEFNTGGEEEKLIENIITKGDRKTPGIVSTTEQENILGLQNPKAAEKVLRAEEQHSKEAENRFQMAKVALGTALLIPVSSFFLSAIFLSTDGVFANLLPQRNYGLILERKEAEVEKINQSIATKQQETTDFNQKILDIKENKVLAEIIDTRISWDDILENIRTITNRTFEGNEISQYVTYISYAGKSDQKQITVQGEVRSARGDSWKDLIRLKDALNAYENFTGVDITQFTKQRASTTAQVTSSAYTSPFNFQFTYIPDSVLAAEEAAHAAAE